MIPLEFPLITSNDFGVNFIEDASSLAINFNYSIWNECQESPSLDINLFGNYECNSTNIKNLHEKSMKSNETALIDIKGYFLKFLFYFESS